jgi:hypothetical protein
MRMLRWYMLIIIAVIAIEALFRWSNDLAMTRTWLTERVAFMAFQLVVSGWFLRRELRRERETGKSGDTILFAMFMLLVGGVGVIGWAWRGIDALWTGTVLVSTVPAAYTMWSGNPWGFAIALGFCVLGVLMFGLFFISGALTIRDRIRRRRGPA